MRPTDGATVLIHEANSSDRVEQMQHLWLRFEVFKEGALVQSQLRTHRLRWYHKHEFVMMRESVGYPGEAYEKVSVQVLMLSTRGSAERRGPGAPGPLDGRPVECPSCRGASYWHLPGGRSHLPLPQIQSSTHPAPGGPGTKQRHDRGFCT